MDKKSLSERDICTKFITPAILKSGWDNQKQLLEEVGFTDGKIIVRGRLTPRGARKRADYILYYKPNIPIAIIEAKDNKHSVRSGIQQALDYAQILDIPCAFSSNGDGFFSMIEPQQIQLSKQNLVLMNFHRHNNYGRSIRNIKVLRLLKKRELPLRIIILMVLEEDHDIISKLLLTELLKP